MAPKFYECSECEAQGCKLYRDSHIFLNEVELLCKRCTIVRRAKQIDEYAKSIKQKTLGDWVVAVPDQFPNLNWALPKDCSFWGVTSVPMSGAMWYDTLRD